MKKIFLLSFIFLVLLTACKDSSFNRPQELRFSGAGEHWEAVFIQEFTEVWDKKIITNTQMKATIQLY